MIILIIQIIVAAINFLTMEFAQEQKLPTKIVQKAAKNTVFGQALITNPVVEIE